MICRASNCGENVLFVLFAIAITALSTVATAANYPVSITAVDCSLELDAVVAEASNASQNMAVLDRRLEVLDTLCQHLPQIAHNRGVLAARAGRLPEAISHFKKALALDRRAAMTHQHLQQIFEYRAAMAYSRALGNPEPVTEPAFALQDSSLLNADSTYTKSDRSQFHTISTVEYELYAWWQAHQMKLDIAEHYVDEFPEAAMQPTQRAYLNEPWDELQREIAFTANDAVVVLSDTSQPRTLLLLRLTGTRWKIYQETLL